MASLFFGQNKANMTCILDVLLDNLTVSKAKQRGLIKPHIRSGDLEGLSTRDLCDEILGGFADYYLLRDIFLSTYAREVRTDHRGQIDTRKFRQSVEKIAKREGLIQNFGFGLNYHSNRIWLVSIFSEIEFERREKLALSSFDKGIEYEKQVVAALISNGLSAELTTSGADFGADLIFSFMDKKFIGQCKALNKASGVKAVQETVTAISHYKADYGVVFSEMGFSEPAVKLAYSNQVLLVSGLDIKSMMRQIIVVLT